MAETDELKGRMEAVSTTLFGIQTTALGFDDPRFPAIVKVRGSLAKAIKSVGVSDLPSIYQDLNQAIEELTPSCSGNISVADASKAGICSSLRTLHEASYQANVGATQGKIPSLAPGAPIPAVPPTSTAPILNPPLTTTTDGTSPFNNSPFTPTTPTTLTSEEVSKIILANTKAAEEALPDLEKYKSDSSGSNYQAAFNKAISSLEKAKVASENACTSLGANDSNCKQLTNINTAITSFKEENAAVVKNNTALIPNPQTKQKIGEKSRVQDPLNITAEKDKVKYALGVTDTLHINFTKIYSESATGSLEETISNQIYDITTSLKIPSTTNYDAKNPDNEAALELAIEQLEKAKTLAVDNCPKLGKTSLVCLQLPNIDASIASVKDALDQVKANKDPKVVEPPNNPAPKTRSTPGKTSPQGTNTNRSYKVKPETWGVKFSYLAPLEIAGNFEEQAWFLSLLPAMRSSVPVQGGMDTPNAMPGLGFKIIPNIAKHKIVGFQPAYQHLGIDTIAISLVGMFTGVDGNLPEPVFLNDKQKYYNTFTSDSRFFEPEPAILGLKYKNMAEIVNRFDAYRDMQSFYKFAVMSGKELTVEINLARNTRYDYSKIFNPLRDPTNLISPLRDPNTGNPKFKGVVKRVEAYHARQDRTWYVIDMEITDAGIRSDKAINLTNDITAQIEAANPGSTAAANQTSTGPIKASPDEYDKILKCLKSNQYQITPDSQRRKSKFSYNILTGQGWAEDNDGQILSPTDTINYIADRSKTGLDEERTLLELQKYIYTFNMTLTDAKGVEVYPLIKINLPDIIASLEGITVTGSNPTACGQKATPIPKYVEPSNVRLVTKPVATKPVNTSTPSPEELTLDEATVKMNTYYSVLSNLQSGDTHDVTPISNIVTPDFLAKIKDDVKRQDEEKYSYEPREGNHTILKAAIDKAKTNKNTTTINITLKQHYDFINQGVKTGDTELREDTPSLEFKLDPSSGQWKINQILYSGR